jgi:Ribbon-helix-helix protein
MKDAGLRIRVQRELREQFLEVCRAQDKPAAQVLREFMREYVAENGRTGEATPPTRGSQSEPQLSDLDAAGIGERRSATR